MKRLAPLTVTLTPDDRAYIDQLTRSRIIELDHRLATADRADAIAYQIEKRHMNDLRRTADLKAIYD